MLRLQSVNLLQAATASILNPNIDTILGTCDFRCDYAIEAVKPYQDMPAHLVLTNKTCAACGVTLRISIFLRQNLSL